MSQLQDKKRAFLGPVLSLLCTFGLAAAALTFYGERVVEKTGQAVAQSASLALSGERFDSPVVEAISEKDGRYGLIQGTPGADPYPYLHELRYLKLSEDPSTFSQDETVSQPHWTAWLRGRDDAQAWTQEHHFVATHPIDRQTVAIVVLPRQTIDFGHLYTVLFLGLLFSGLVWFIGLRWGTALGGWAYPVGGGLALLIALATITRTLIFVHAYGAHLPESLQQTSPTWTVVSVLSGCALPIILAIYFSWKRQGAPSPHRTAYTYVGPALVGLVALVLIPFLFGLGLAFFDFSSGQPEWAGLAHFHEILTSQTFTISEPLNFYFTLGVTILWTALNVFLHVTIGLALALLLNRPNLKFRGVYRMLLIVPWAVPTYITALVWKGMFNLQFGAVNTLLERIGLEKVDWFSEFWTSFFANVTTNTWLGFPFMMVVALGALQSIPGDLYEAASIDGASRWQSFRHITWPLLKPALGPAIIIGSVWTFNMFNVIYLVSQGAPEGATDILVTEAYRWAFEKERYGYAAAYSIVIFIVLVGYSWLTQRVGGAAEDEAS